MATHVHVHEDYALNTQKFLKKFIEIYKSCPVLWDPSHPDYTNKHRRKQAQDILLGLFKTVRPDSIRGDVVRKINTIRSNYNRVVRQIKQAEAEGKEYVPTNWQFHELRFLDSIKKPDYQNTETEDATEEYAQDTIETYEAWEPGTEVAEVKIESCPPSPPMNELLFVEMPDNAEEVQETQEVYEKPKLKVLSMPYRKRSSEYRVTKKRLSQPSPSSIEPIAMVWSSKLQALSATQRLYAEKAINDVLFEAGMGNLGKGILVINPGSSSVASADDEPEYVEYTTD